MSSISEVRRLYSVTMTVTAVVLAVGESEAEAAFRSAQRDIVSDGTADIYVDHEIRRAKDLPDGWDEECHPYGTDEHGTIGHWLDLVPPPVVRDTKTIDMFAGVVA